MQSSSYGPFQLLLAVLLVHHSAPISALPSPSSAAKSNSLTIALPFGSIVHQCECNRCPPLSEQESVQCLLSGKTAAGGTSSACDCYLQNCLCTSTPSITNQTLFLQKRGCFGFFGETSDAAKFVSDNRKTYKVVRELKGSRVVVVKDRRGREYIMKSPTPDTEFAILDRLGDLVDRGTSVQGDQSVNVAIIKKYPGETMQKVLESNPPWETVRQLVLTGMEGLQQLNSKGIYHKDAATRNVMVSPDGTHVNWIDFDRSFFIEDIKRGPATAADALLQDQQRFLRDVRFTLSIQRGNQESTLANLDALGRDLGLDKTPVFKHT